MAKIKAPAEEVLSKPHKEQAASGRYNLNIVPLIDVLFLLLLFFILGSTFRVEEGQIPGSLPRVGGSDAVNREENKVKLQPLQVNIRPSADNMQAQFEVEGQPRQMSAEELYQYLSSRYEGAKATDPDWVLSIKPLQMVRWEYIVQVYNQAARAGFKTIGFDQTGG